MGLANEGMFGPTSGKVGNLVYYKRNGKSIVRRIGVTDKPASVAQLANRQRMAVAMSFCKAVLPFMHYGFMQQVLGKDLSQINVGMSYNKLNAMKGTYPDLQIDYAKALVSEGPLLQADQVQVEVVTDGLKFNWYVDPQLRWPDNTDQVMLLAYFPGTSSAVFNLFGPERSKGTATLEIGEPLLGEHMETFIAFISADRKQVSTSVHAGALNAPAASLSSSENAQERNADGSREKNSQQDQKLNP